MYLNTYLCKHFFAVFRKFRTWQWDVLSPLYINSLFLTLDNFDANDYFDDISHVEDQKISEGINNMTHQDESSIDILIFK